MKRTIELDLDDIKEAIIQHVSDEGESKAEIEKDGKKVEVDFLGSSQADAQRDRKEQKIALFKEMYGAGRPKLEKETFCAPVTRPSTYNPPGLQQMEGTISGRLIYNTTQFLARDTPMVRNEEGTWRPALPGEKPQAYMLCDVYIDHDGRMSVPIPHDAEAIEKFN